ncbi:hypothetical protein CYLTODRAFT_370660 [Cylindrobasidium torrendii FP15055 ss-10]|uniref:Protein YIF1 n=1 Tax=Cylindrobasidium torrendii FP15055 ss-10 TaxID=1314674 RepID=A0A0D7BJE6_9AGAR|nr:hypothetical protein CYLTODRAFT_370660 [Cylindrobasidium torrendii FP15055 ss-10]
MQPAPQGYGQQHVDLNAWGINDATAQLGMQLGNSAVHAGQEYVQKNFGGIFQGAGVKHKFNVSNGYVLRKLAMLLFPWTHKPWSRRGRRTEQGQMEYSDPREDVNSPDLYIPLMALVTYILVSAFHSGLQDRFHPSVLGSYATTAVVVALFDTGFVSLACYVLSVPQSQPLDVMAYTGYKFVGVIATILAGFVVGRTIWLGVYLYFFLANAFFMLRSLRSVVLPDLAMQGTQTTSPGSRRRRIFFLFLEAACQVIYMGILVRV